MKRSILSLAIVLLRSLWMRGQKSAYYETYAIQWSDVKAAIAHAPDSIGALIDRLAAGDSTLRTREILTAYMANSYEHCSPFGDAREARDALHKGEVAKAMSLMDAAIKKNPLSLTNNYYYIVCVHASHPELDEQPNAPLNDSIRQLLELPATRFRLIESAIYYSGNGSARLPYKVTSVDDEYTFMRMLDLPQHTSQSLTNDLRDHFTLPPHSSTAYQGNEIDFDASRIIEQEQELFGE